MKKILVTMQLDAAQKNLLERQTDGFDCAFVYRKNSELTADDLRGIDWIIGSPPPELLNEATNLEWLQIVWAGADTYLNIPPEIILTNARGAYDAAVSEHLLALTLALTRRIDLYVRRQEKHLWQRTREVSSVKDSTVLVIGAGSIGAAYAKAVKTLGAKVIGIRRTKKPSADFDEIYTADELDAVIGRADIVAMILPGGNQTNHFMDAEKLSKLKDGAYLINVGRGNAIDPDALKNSLRAGKLSGVALDVTEPEPLPADDELWDFDNVIITPHDGGNLHSKVTRDAIVKICADNLHRKIHGEPLKNIVDRAAGY